MRKTAVLPGGCAIHTHDEQERRARPSEARRAKNRTVIQTNPAAGACLGAANAAERQTGDTRAA